MIWHNPIVHCLNISPSYVLVVDVDACRAHPFRPLCRGVHALATIGAASHNPVVYCLHVSLLTNAETDKLPCRPHPLRPLCRGVHALAPDGAVLPHMLWHPLTADETVLAHMMWHNPIVHCLNISPFYVLIIDVDACRTHPLRPLCRGVRALAPDGAASHNPVVYCLHVSLLTNAETDEHPCRPHPLRPLCRGVHALAPDGAVLHRPGRAPGGGAGVRAAPVAPSSAASGSFPRAAVALGYGVRASPGEIFCCLALARPRASGCFLQS